VEVRLRVIVKFFLIFHLSGHPESSPEPRSGARLVSQGISGFNKKRIDAEIETLNLIQGKVQQNEYRERVLSKNKGVAKLVSTKELPKIKIIWKKLNCY